MRTRLTQPQITPNIWSNGSWEPIPHLDVEVLGAGAFTHDLAYTCGNHNGVMLRVSTGNSRAAQVCIFASSLGPRQRVQRAEYWGVILALQAFPGIHIGIDHMNVIGGVAKLLDKGSADVRLPLIRDGAVFVTVLVTGLCQSIRGEGLTDQFMVADGSIWQNDLVGNDGADTAADLGRVRQNDGVVSASRVRLQSWCQWYRIKTDIHRSMVAVSRIVVNHNGYDGTAFWMLWFGIMTAFPIVALLPPDSSSTLRPFQLLLEFWESSWFRMLHSPVTQDHVADGVAAVASESSDLRKFGIEWWASSSQ